MIHKEIYLFEIIKFRELQAIQCFYYLKVFFLDNILLIIILIRFQSLFIFIKHFIKLTEYYFTLLIFYLFILYKLMKENC